jgi:hypothetical protein
VDGAPAGFSYYPGLLSGDEEPALVAAVRAIDFAPVEMRGQIARRRTSHFGWVF